MIDPVRLAWLLRSDVRGDAPTDSLPQRFALWWAVNGRAEYPAWSSFSPPLDAALFVPLPDWPAFGRFGMCPLLRHLFDQREDLRQAFDVTTAAGLWHAIAWLFSYGLREYRLQDSVDALTLQALDDTPPLFGAATSDGEMSPDLTWLMFFVWRCGEDLQAAFDLRTPDGRTGYLHWFFAEGVQKFELAPLLAPRWRQWLLEPHPHASGGDAAVPRAAMVLWQRRDDLKGAFDLRQAEGWAGLARWAAKELAGEPGLRWLTATPADPPPLPSLSPLPVQAIAAAPRPFGVNLIGFALGELGIGEDVRMAAAACEAVGIPHAVVSIATGPNTRQSDLHVQAKLVAAAEAPYAINVFCLTGFDTAGAYLQHGLPLFAGHRNIGWWPWELPVWPGDWQVAFDLVDEVWAATEFTREMYTRAQIDAVPPVTEGNPNPCGTPTFKPVTLMPLPASVARAVPVTRRKLGLPAKRFLFLYVFDFNSYLARKNPFAALRAFDQAFGQAFDAADAGVGLVLKTMNSDPKNPLWRRFVRECARDPRITLLDKTLDRGEVLGLIQSCDAYLSLHRAEGFGRTLAEAMLFGKPVVGTDFSGNVDFLKAEVGFPVRWRRRPVKSGEYPFVRDTDAAWWAEPDIADAARQMRAARAAAKDTAFAERVKTFAELQFSPERIGRLMQARLEALCQKP